MFNEGLLIVLLFLFSTPSEAGFIKDIAKAEILHQVGKVVVKQLKNKTKDIKKKKKIENNKTYQIYQKANPQAGKTYIGRTSGTASARRNVENRDLNHHRTTEGYGRAQEIHTSAIKDAIRGQEQILIDKHRAEGTAAEQINGISPKNPKRQHYLNEAKKEFPPA